MTCRIVGGYTTGGVERIAYHEAGHVAGWCKFQRAIFVDRGRVLIAADWGRTSFNRP